jgi:hypothetical protein
LGGANAESSTLWGSAAMNAEETAEEIHIFFTLPPEIRHQIYRLLLAPKDEKRWIHHAILQCSRRFNEEGTTILYREQTFKLEWFTGSESLLKVWFPSSEKFNLVTRMTIDPYVGVAEKRVRHSDTANEVLSKFPALSEAEIELTRFPASSSLSFLRQVREQLDRIEKVILVLWIAPYPGLTSDTPQVALRKKYKFGCGDMFYVPHGYLGRGVKMEYQPPKAEFQLFGAQAILRLTLEKETSVLA